MRALRDVGGAFRLEGFFLLLTQRRDLVLDLLAKGDNVGAILGGLSACFARCRCGLAQRRYPFTGSSRI